MCICFILLEIGRLAMTTLKLILTGRLGGHVTGVSAKVALVALSVLVNFHLPEELPSCLFRQFTAGDISD